MFREYLNSKRPETITHNFLITINKNQSIKSVENEDVAKREFKAGMRKMFDNFEQFIDIHKSGDYEKRKLNMDFSDVATSVSVIPRIEVGGKRGMIHAHILIRWQSIPKFFFQINQSKLRRWINENIGCCYLNIRWINNDAAAFKYVDKQS